MFTTAFFVHRILAILFLLLIPLPFVALIKKRKQTELRSSVVWQNLIRVTNISLVFILITGKTIYPIFNSIRLWIAVALTLAIGGMLGVISKQLKLYNLKHDQTLRTAYLRKISTFSFIYIGLIVVIFGFMAHWYQI